jgi:hypothetical protein
VNGSVGAGEYGSEGAEVGRPYAGWVGLRIQVVVAADVQSARACLETDCTDFTDWQSFAWARQSLERGASLLPVSFEFDEAVACLKVAQRCLQQRFEPGKEDTVGGIADSEPEQLRSGRGP